jgi:hypothetical protein
MSNEQLDLMLPFSELFSAESGVIRRDLEAAAKAANVPALNEGTSCYTGGETIKYSLH